jgi:hypothetical protein
MFKVRSVLFLMIAALVTGVLQCVGLHRAAQLWNARAVETPCPAPPAAELPPEPAPEPEAPPPPETKKRHQIGWLSVRRHSVEIDVDGRRLELEGYPDPRSADHSVARLTKVALTPDREQIAIAGECPGSSGVAEPRVPSCVPVFVRLYRLTDGAHLRDLKTPWHVGTEDERRVLAMAFDSLGERLAVLMMSSWSDCSWGGDDIELVVYRVADGKRLTRRDLETPHRGEMHSIDFFGNGLHIVSVDANGRTKRRVLHVRPAHLAKATTAS